MTTPEQRQQMAAAIVDFEARRDAAGHLMVYHPPSGDGGGAYEVAGINARYNRSTAKTLVGLIRQQRFDVAERLATDFIARNTDCAAAWTDVPAIEFYLRDCVFNRGATGAALILQRALGVDPTVRSDRIHGRPRKRPIRRILLARLRTAREQYERDVAHRNEHSKFWAGLSARWDRAIEIAERFPMTPAPTPVIDPRPWQVSPPANRTSRDRSPRQRHHQRQQFSPAPQLSAAGYQSAAGSPVRTLRVCVGTSARQSGGDPHLGRWEHDNIVEVPIPQLRKVLGDKAPTSIRFHRLAANQLQSLWAEWETAGLINRVLSFGGGFVARFVRGSRSVLSNHAFGSAFDINEAYNPFGRRPLSNGRKGCVRELVPIANRNGFYWGGHYQSRMDGMHFEIAVLDRRLTPQLSPDGPSPAGPPTARRCTISPRVPSRRRRCRSRRRLRQHRCEPSACTSGRPTSRSGLLRNITRLRNICPVCKCAAD